MGRSPAPDRTAGDAAAPHEVPAAGQRLPPNRDECPSAMSASGGLRNRTEFGHFTILPRCRSLCHSCRKTNCPLRVVGASRQFMPLCGCFFIADLSPLTRGLPPFIAGPTMDIREFSQYLHHLPSTIIQVPGRRFPLPRVGLQLTRGLCNWVCNWLGDICARRNSVAVGVV